MKYKCNKINGKAEIPDYVFEAAWNLLGSEKQKRSTILDTDEILLKMAISSLRYGKDWEKHYFDKDIEYDLNLFKKLI